MSPILASLRSRKELTSFMPTTAPCDQQKPLQKNMCMFACIRPSSQNHVYPDLPAASLQQLLRAISGAATLTMILILPQTELSSQLSQCAFLKCFSSQCGL